MPDVLTENPYNTAARDERAVFRSTARRHTIWRDTTLPEPIITAADGTQRELTSSRFRGARSEPASLCKLPLVELVDCHSRDHVEDVMNAKDDGPLVSEFSSPRNMLQNAVHEGPMAKGDPVQRIKAEQRAARLA